MSQVVFKRVSEASPVGIARAIEEALSRISLPVAEVGARPIVKVNAMSDELFPGRNTSPWVLDAMLGWLRGHYPDARFVMADTDVAGSRQFARACRNWGYDGIARRHGIEIINLSHAETVAVATGNAALPTLDFPRPVMEASSIINLPVLKTHVLSGITCALKNHWGLLPRVRYQFHPILSEVIATINATLRQTVLSVVDGTVCIEGPGPKTGVPRVANVLFASRDRVAIDAAILRFIGMPAAMAPHVARAAEMGVGTTAFEIDGDAFKPEPFDLPVQSKDLVSLIEAKVRAIPVLGKVAYSPPVARVLGMIGTQYNKLVWMNLHGRAHIRAIQRHHDYGPEFSIR
jgi:uncharacterized protein (DUF362 family)